MCFPFGVSRLLFSEVSHLVHWAACQFTLPQALFAGRQQHVGVDNYWGVRDVATNQGLLDCQ
jgi:hypothetical protein